MRNFTKFLVLAFMISIACNDYAYTQTSVRQYELTTAIETYTPLANSTVIISGSSTDSELKKVAIPGGFPFLGRTHDSITISSNGHVSFPNASNQNSVSTSTYTILSDALTNTGGGIAAYAADLLAISTDATTANVSYALEGNEFIVQWKNSKRYLANTSDTLNFQIRLNQSNGQIKIVYGSCNPQATASYQGQLGLRGTTTSDFIALTIPATGGSWQNALISGINTAQMYFNGANPNTKPLLGTTFIFTPKTCPVVSMPTATNLTTSSFTLNWDTPAGASTYEYYVSTENAFPINTVGTIVSNNSATISGLSSNTAYYLWVRTHCGGTESTSWSQMGTGITLCGPKDIPYTYNFELATTPTLPSCISSVSITGNLWSTSTVSGSKVGRHVSLSATASNSWLFTEGLNLIGGKAYKLSYKYAGSSTSYTQKMKVAFGTNNNISEMTDVLVEHLEIKNNAFVSNVVYFVPPTTGIYYIGFQAMSAANQGSLYIDDISVDLLPNCLTPENIALTNAEMNEVTISWSAPILAPANGYEYYYSTSNIAPDANTTGTAVSSTSINITGLTPNTQYYIWVRSLCPSDASSWSVAFAFRTRCTTMNVPYLQDFESVTTPALPECTSVQNVGTGNVWTTGTFSSSKALLYAYSSTSAANTWFYTPGINLTAGVSYRISYKTVAALSGYVERLKVSYGTTPTSTSMTTVLSDHPSINYSTYRDTFIDFIVSTTGVYYFGFNAYSIADRYQLYVDDILIDFSPTCLTPSDVILTNIAHNSATISWTAPITAPANGYEYYYSTTNSTPTSATLGTANPTNTLNLTGLSSSTTYYLWVRSNCGNGDISAWLSIPSFTTLCTPEAAPTVVQDFTSYVDRAGNGTSLSCWTEAKSVAATPYLPVPQNAKWTNSNFRYVGTNKSARINLYGTSIDWLISHPIDLGATPNAYRVKYKKALNNNISTVAATTYGSHVVQLIVSLDGGITWDVANVIYTHSGTEVFADSIVTVNLPYTGVVHFAFRAVTSSTSPDVDFYVDDFVVEAVPTCDAPSTLIASNITDNSVNLNWTAPAVIPANGYEYYYSTASATPALTVTGSSVTSTTASINGLTENTVYYIWVRSICGANESSAWSTPQTFTTQCLATNVPYLQNFETVTIPALPECTSVENVGLGNVWNTVTALSSKVLRYPVSTTQAANTWFYTQGINLTAGVSYRISYKTAASSTANTEQLTVAYGTVAMASAMTNPLINHTSINYNTFRDTFADFVPTTTGVYYFGFHAHSAAAQGSLYVDDIFINVTPTCFIPTNVVASQVAMNTATITWNAPTLGTTPTAYEYYYSTSSIAPTSSAATLTTTLNSIALSSLLSDTTYYVWVRSVCGASDNSYWSASTSFRTGYCVPTGSTTYMWGSFVTTGAEQNINFTNSTSAVYLNHSNIVLKAYPNQTINVTAQASSTPAQLHFLWIDWNNDLDFDDAGEAIYATSTTSTIYNGSFTIPSTIPAGTYRMRAALATANGTPSPSPCASGWGRYVDFTLEVVQPCPAITTTMSATHVCGTALGSATVAVQTTANTVSYLWGSGETTASITGLNIGNYIVTITTDPGCTTVDSIQVTSSTLSVAATVLSQDCGASNGSINLTAVGNNLSYLWSNGETTATISGLAVGAYTVTVSDNICERIITTDIIYAEEFVVTGTIVNESADVSATGSVTITAPMNATYAWSNGETTAAITGLEVGIYTVTVTDGNGCYVIKSFEVEREIAVGEIALNQIKLYPNPTTQIVNISGIPTNSKVTLVNNLGQIIYFFESQNDLEVIDFADLAPSTYWIRIENQNNSIVLPIVRIK